MTVRELARSLGLRVYTSQQTEDVEISGGYAGDLLSDVMAHACEGCVWVTIQTHQNIVAVAVLSGIHAVVICGGRVPDEDTLVKAEREKIAVLGSSESSYETVGRIYGLLR